MQLTRFDRWLREKFVHEIHIYSMRPPEIIPSGVISEEVPASAARQFSHKYVARNTKAAEALISEFKEHNQMFTTRVVDRTGWHVRFVAPEDKSVTWWFVWVIVSAIFLFIVTNAIRTLWSNPEFQKNFYDAIEVLQG